MSTFYTRIAVYIGLASALFAFSSAHAVSYSFVRVSNNADENVASQFSVDVTSSSGFVTFLFQNTAAIPASITDVYFQDANYIELPMTITSSAGVQFNQFAKPSSPGIPDFTNTKEFSADSEKPTAPNGIDAASEWLNIRFSLGSGVTFNNLLSAMDRYDLDIALKVQSIGDDGNSDWYRLSTRTNVPDGGLTATLLGSALLGLGVLRRKLRA